MNNAVIQYAGPARDVVKHPKSEFMTKFLGGRHVLTLGSQKPSLRPDGTGLIRNGTGLIRNGTGMTVTVQSMACQRAHVSIGLVPE